jgi:hypothetical protein
VSCLASSHKHNNAQQPPGHPDLLHHFSSSPSLSSSSPPHTQRLPSPAIHRPVTLTMKLLLLLVAAIAGLSQAQVRSSSFCSCPCRGRRQASYCRLPVLPRAPTPVFPITARAGGLLSPSHVPHPDLVLPNPLHSTINLPPLPLPPPLFQDTTTSTSANLPPATVRDNDISASGSSLRGYGVKGFVVPAEHSKDPACGKVSGEGREGGREGGRE